MYRFGKNEIPFGYRLNYKTWLYNMEEHRLLQNSTGWHSYYLLNDKLKTVDAGVHFWLNGNTAKSPCKSPSGGYDVNEELPGHWREKFVREVDADLLSLGATSREIKLPARLVGDRDPVEDALRQQGYATALEEKAAMIPVSDRFEDKLHYSEQKRLRKLESFDFVAEALPLDRWREVYRFIRHCRIEKGFSISLTEQEIEPIVQAFPDRVLLYVVRADKEWAAAAFALRTRHDVVYDFYHDHNAEFDAFSPVVLLVKQMNDSLLKTSIKWIDLGTSMHGTEVNQDLHIFKMRLGGLESVKYTLIKEA